MWIPLLSLTDFFAQARDWLWLTLTLLSSYLISLLVLHRRLRLRDRTESRSTNSRKSPSLSFKQVDQAYLAKEQNCTDSPILIEMHTLIPVDWVEQYSPSCVAHTHTIKFTNSKYFVLEKQSQPTQTVCCIVPYIVFVLFVTQLCN